ncbi:hypothetical protein AO375_1638 [Moraxella catarrhalis]|nr:hypothetical protein AO375_1638 [Moraxella catarrhalis]
MTTTKSSKPMVCSARAAEPILAGRVVPIITIRMRDSQDLSKSFIIIETPNDHQ